MLILEEFCIKSKYEIIKIGEENLKKEKEKYQNKKKEKITATKLINNITVED